MARGKEIDERFKQVLTDPRFRTLRKKDRKIRIDSRFKGMFEKDFNGQCRVDKRGRVLDRPTESTLKKFYEVASGEDSDSDDQAEDEEEETIEDEDITSKKKGKAGVTSDKILTDPIAGPSDASKNGLRTDLRGEYNSIVSSSSDEETSDEEDVDVEEIDHNWGELDKDAPRSENITNRLAVCNVDWDRIKAQDVFVLFHSFKPETGFIKSVKVYPSQFGKERMEEEKIRGPKELTDMTISDDEAESSKKSKRDDDVIDLEDSMVSEKLRQYQINRLKYFYAVVECDSVETARSLYDQLNGMEYESSASALDVRVIPDDVTFDEDEPASECYTLPTLGDYKPPNFVTTALQQSKVRLTWDETDPERSKTFQRAFTERDKCADDLAVYLASSSGEETDSDYDADVADISESKNDTEKIEAYRNLIKSLDEETANKDVDMEVTWDPEVEKIGQEIVDKKKKDEMTVFEREREEKKLKKKKNVEARKSKRFEKSNKSDCNMQNESSDENIELDTEDAKNSEEALMLLTMDDEHDKKHFKYDNYIEDDKSKGKKRRKKSKQVKMDGSEDGFKFDSEDPRFSGIYNSHLYNIDQSSSHFKKTKAIEEILYKKAKIEHTNASIPKNISNKVTNSSKRSKLKKQNS